MRYPVDISRYILNPALDISWISYRYICASWVAERLGDRISVLFFSLLSFTQELHLIFEPYRHLRVNSNMFSGKKRIVSNTESDCNAFFFIVILSSVAFWFCLMVVPLVWGQLCSKNFVQQDKKTGYQTKVVSRKSIAPTNNSVDFETIVNITMV